MRHTAHKKAAHVQIKRNIVLIVNQKLTLLAREYNQHPNIVRQAKNILSAIKRKDAEGIPDIFSFYKMFLLNRLVNHV